MQGNNGIATNSGAITLTGSSNYGINLLGIGSTLLNTGTITSAVSGASGIGSDNSDNIVTNSGIITLSGDGSSGSVTTSGTSSHGLISAGSTSTINNSGTVIVNDASSYSVYVTDVFSTLNLNEGSVLYGDVRFGSTASQTLNFGAGLNALVQTNDGAAAAAIPNTITTINGAYVVSGRIIHVADGTGFAASDMAGLSAGGLIGDALSSRGNGTVLVTKGASGSTRWGKIIGAGLSTTTGQTAPQHSPQSVAVLPLDRTILTVMASMVGS